MATTGKRKSSVASDLRRPFKPGVLDKAKKIADAYQIVIVFDREEGEFEGRCVELPLVFGFGKDPNACVRETRALVATTVASMMDDGEHIPSPRQVAER